MPDDIDKFKRLFAKKDESEDSSPGDTPIGREKKESLNDDLLSEIWGSKRKPENDEPQDKQIPDAISSGDSPTNAGKPEPSAPPKSDRPDARAAFSMIAREGLKKRLGEPEREGTRAEDHGSPGKDTGKVPGWAEGVTGAKEQGESRDSDADSTGRRGILESRRRFGDSPPDEDIKVEDFRAKFLGQSDTGPKGVEEEPGVVAGSHEHDDHDSWLDAKYEEESQPLLESREEAKPVKEIKEPAVKPAAKFDEPIKKPPEQVRPEPKKPVEAAVPDRFTYTPKRFGAEPHEDEFEDTEEDMAARVNEGITEAVEKVGHLRDALFSSPSGEEPKIGKRKKPIYSEPVAKFNPLVNLIGLVGGICLGLALILSMLDVSGGTSLMGLSGIGTIMIISYSIANRRNLKLILSARSTRYGTNVAIVILTLLAILVVLNSIGYNHYIVFDVTAGKLNTLSEQTMQVLEKLSSAGTKVTATVFVPREKEYAQVRGTLEDTLEKYRHNFPAMEINYSDPDVNRQLAEELGFEERVGVVFQAGDKREKAVEFTAKSPLSFEAALTGALLRLGGTGAKRVYFLTGHDELIFDDYNEQSMRSDGLFAQALELAGFQLKDLSLAGGGGIPSDCNILFIAGPGKDLSQPEIDAVRAYLDKGGRVVALLEAGYSAGLGSLLEEYGIHYRADLIADSNNNLNSSDSLHPVLELNEHEITAPLLRNRDEVAFFRASGIDVKPDKQKGYFVERLLSTKAGGSWSESGEGDETVMDPEEERGPFTMAVMAGKEVVTPEEIPAEEAESADETPSEPTHKGSNWGLMLVAGDSSFITNPNLGTYGNKDFILNAVEYMTSDEALITIRPKETAPMIELQKAQAGLVFLVSIILIPLLVAGFGVTVWLRRK